MKFTPCQEDTRIVFFGSFLSLSAELFLIYACKWNPFAICAMILLDVVLAPIMVRDYMYFSRTVLFDQEGCDFRAFGRRQKIGWEALDVLLFERDSSFLNDGDILGPGILIVPKGKTYTGFLSPMTFCRRKFPINSVFLRFFTDKDPKPWDTARTVYSGYTVEKEELTAYLDHIGVKYSRFIRSYARKTR